MYTLFSMNKTLCIVYSNLGLGGIPKRIIDIVNEMGFSRPNTTVHILLKERRAFDLRATITNPRVIIRDFYSWSPNDNALLFILWVWAYIFTCNPDILLSFISPYALPVLATKFMFFWRKPRLIINEGHFTSTMIQSMAMPGIQRMGITVLYPHANVIITPTAEVKNDLSRSYHVPRGKMEIIQNWSTYAKNPLPKQPRIYDLIYTGRIDTTKNILPLMKILHTIIKRHKPHLNCVLVGDGSCVPQCVAYITVHGLQNNISVLPPVLDVSAYLKQTRIFIFNPDTKTEGFPVSILDSMACGTVVITKKFTGVDTVLNKTNGYVVSTAREMEQCIVRVLNTYTSQQSIIQSAKRHVARFNSLENIQSYIHLFS